MKTIRLLAIAGLALGASSLSAQTIYIDILNSSNGAFHVNGLHSPNQTARLAGLDGVGGAGYTASNGVTYDDAFGVINLDFSIAANWASFDFDEYYYYSLDGDVRFGGFYGMNPPSTPEHVIPADVMFGPLNIPTEGSMNAVLFPFVQALYSATWGLPAPHEVSFFGGDVVFVFDPTNKPDEAIPNLITGSLQIISMIDLATLDAALVNEFGMSWFGNGLDVVPASDVTFGVQGLVTLTAVPEPATIGMLGVGGLLGLAVVRRRFSKKSA